jgi:hypothetical protein
MPTETLEGLRRAKEPDMQELMAAWIRSAYSEVLAFVDPNDPETAIRDAFRPYNPVGQQPRMVSLFLGLCRAAGLCSTTATPESRPRSSARKATTTSPKPSRQKQSGADQPAPSLLDRVPAPIAGLLGALPQAGQGWTQAERDKFATTFGTVLDFCYPVITKSVDLIDEIDPLT